MLRENTEVTVQEHTIVVDGSELSERKELEFVVDGNSEGQRSSIFRDLQILSNSNEKRSGVCWRKTMIPTKPSNVLSVWSTLSARGIVQEEPNDDQTREKVFEKFGFTCSSKVQEEIMSQLKPNQWSARKKGFTDLIPLELGGEHLCKLNNEDAIWFCNTTHEFVGVHDEMKNQLLQYGHWLKSQSGTLGTWTWSDTT